MRARHEYKYVITNTQQATLQNRILGLLKLDSHVGPEKKYVITSLYFDDINNSCYYDNVNGVDPREKFRIRIYNHDTSRITLECKRKERGKTIKSSCPLTLSQAQSLVMGKAIPNVSSQPPLLQKLTVKMLTSLMRPKVIVEYERIPYVSKLGNVRITFDVNLCSSTDVSDFLNGNYKKRPVMPKDTLLMEVKWDDFLPDTIYRALSVENLQQTAFSKYCLCRRFCLGFALNKNLTKGELNL